MIFAMLATLVGLTGAALPVAASAGSQVDVELVLAVDMSGSMDLEEARIQRAGYVEALRHREFVDAATGGLTGRIAISYFEWAGSVNESSVVGWRVIGSAEDAAAFAADIAARAVTTRRGTSISNALTFGTGLIEGNAFDGLRRVIDVSGDGPNNLGPPVAPARDVTVGTGIVINGLAILIRPSGNILPLDRYYADCVIGGPGAFVVPVRTPADFAVAIRRKLIMEVSGLQPGHREPDIAPIPIAGNPPSDCMIGEKTRPGFLDR